MLSIMPLPRLTGLIALLAISFPPSTAMADTMSAAKNFDSPCSALAASLGSKVSYPSDPSYQAAENSYFSQQEGQLAPTCMVAPTSSQDVSTVIKTLNSVNDQNGNKYPFAIRGGGHTSNAGAANINGGVTINLRSMNTVTVSSDRSLTSIGGGAKWSEVYSQLDALGLSTSGGRVSDVGVGGLTTGGGISYFSGRYGLVCDNVVSYEVVLANNKIVTASQTENNDLWLALKGGSSNFGIVTRFDIRTFPQGTFYGGVIVYPISTLSAQLAAFANLTANFDPYAAIIMSFSWSQKNGYSVFNNLEYTKADPNPPTMQPFTSLQPQYLNTMRISTLSDFATESSAFAPSGLRQTFVTTTFKNDLKFLQTVYNFWNASIASLSSVQNLNWAMSIQPIPPAFSDKTPALGGNSLGLNPSDGPLVLFLLSYTWSLSSDDATMEAAAKNLIGQIDSAAQNAGLYSRFKYLNYAAAWQDVFDGYGAANKANLQAASKKYDPSGLFQTGSPGGFKVFG